MKPSKQNLVLGLLAVGMLGVFWAVSAQEGRRLFAPPPVLPSDNIALPRPAPTKKGKADATLIIPAEAYDVPRPVKGGVVIPNDRVRGAAHVEETVPPPMIPPTPPVLPRENKVPGPLPVLPAIEEKPLVAPTPLLDPSKALIVEPAGREEPQKLAPVVPMPPPPVAPLPPPGILIDSPKPPPRAAVGGDANGTDMKPPVIAAPTMILPAAAPTPKLGAFQRIDSAASNPAPVTPMAPVAPPLGVTLPPPARVVVPPDTLAHLQTPSVSVAKHGKAAIRAGETCSYQISVQNRGPVAAQQIRIEDELPAGVQMVSADPMPAMLGNKAAWTLSTLPVNVEQVLRFTLKATSDTELPSRLGVQVGTATQATTTVLRPRNDVAPMTIQLTGPASIAVGKEVVFEVRVANQSAQPLTGIVLHGVLPEGLNTPNGRDIEGEVDVTIAPGETKTLKMPASAVKPGRHSVAVKVTARGGHEASATAFIEIVAEGLQLQQASATRLFMGRDGYVHIEVANYTNKLMRNVAVADQLPEGLEFVAASERGLYQANRRTVYWLIDQLPPGKLQTLVVRLSGVKAGQHQNVIFAKADGVGETQASSVVAVEGMADLTLRVEERDNLLELGKETVYEILVQNPGNAPASHVQLQVQFPAGMIPKLAEGQTRHSMDRQTIVFEPIALLEAQGKAAYRVSAIAQSVGDQRVRFAITSDQVRTPIQREISTRVYADRAP